MIDPKHTVITVDLDYWTNHYSRAPESSFKLLKLLKNSTRKRYLIWEHHHILDVIPQNTQRIINIDYHNDIISEKNCDELNEGTWGNFLPNSVRRFEWFCPNKNMCIRLGWGMCNDSQGKAPMPSETNEYPIENIKFTQGWHHMKYSGAHTLVVCVSPAWANLHSYSPYLEYLDINEKNKEKVKKI